MYLELEYYGQNDGTCVPNLTLTGDPGTDNAALTAAGYNSGAIVSILYNGTTTPGVLNLIVHPLDGANSLTGAAPEVPYGFLLLGAGQFSSSITPSGSGKTPVVRAFPKFKVPAAQVTGSTPLNGQRLYTANVGGGVGPGMFTATPGSASTAGSIVVGICTHPISATEPWLGVASFL
jgi:hypothetical protein